MVKIAKRSGEWGEGFDYLFKEIWPNLDAMRKDNLNLKHDRKNIDHCFKFMYSVLHKDAISEIKKTDWDAKDKLEVIEKLNKILRLFKEAKTINDEVIAINMAEQFLRAIY